MQGVTTVITRLSRHRENNMLRKIVLLIVVLVCLHAGAQYNTDKLLRIGRSALYYEDYVLSIQYFNQAITAKPYLYEPWFYRAVAKYYLGDYAGSEADCTEALARNSFVVSVYELRGITRIQRKDYGAAIEDYVKALKYDPHNRGLWHNRVLCRIHKGDYVEALADIDTMIVRWKNYAGSYAMRAEAYLHLKDTTAALAAIEKSIELDPYDDGTWAVRGGIALSHEEWELGEEYLTEAIRLSSKVSTYYINRALARLKLNKLRGAMADYDTALDFDPNNFLGHYNRGLMRAQVGDDNRAIEDFNFVLNLEPDNVMALFNRAVLLQKTGDIRGAIRDLSTVIDEFPNFWLGLTHRAECYRALGMNAKAEEDEFKVYKARLDKSLYGIQPRMDKDKLRKRSDTDPDKYNQIVVADEDEHPQEYANEYRGRVQNRTASMDIMQMYELSYDRVASEVKAYVPYDRAVDAFNNAYAQPIYPKAPGTIYTNCSTMKLTEARSKQYFEYIDTLTARIVDADGQAALLTHLYFRRGVAYSALQDFDSAIEDFTQCLLRDTTFALAYWQRAVCQSKANEVSASQGTDVTMKTANVLSDLTKAIDNSPASAYLRYNRGNVYFERRDYVHAIEDYSVAIALDEAVAEAYFNRGIANILADRKEDGVADLSKAGELGLYEAYSIIKKYRGQ